MSCCAARDGRHVRISDGVTINIGSTIVPILRGRRRWNCLLKKRHTAVYLARHVVLSWGRHAYRGPRSRSCTSRPKPLWVCVAPLPGIIAVTAGGFEFLSPTLYFGTCLSAKNWTPRHPVRNPTINRRIARIPHSASRRKKGVCSLARIVNQARHCRKRTFALRRRNGGIRLTRNGRGHTGQRKKRLVGTPYSSPFQLPRRISNAVSAVPLREVCE